MAKRKKKQLSQADQLTIAQRELAKGNSRQALKYAKACYRKDPSEPARILLQRALLSRGRELHARAMLDPARAVIVELNDLGEVAAEHQADVARLRALLCVDDSGSHGELIENDRQLRDELADNAVLHGPNSAGRSEFREAAKAIREALAAVENDQTDRANELLAPIGRDSSFADWKLLIRGLAAYYQGDEQRMEANWSRLASDRPTRRIADALSVVAGARHVDQVSGPIRARVDRLVRSVESPLVGSLRALQRKTRDPDIEQPALRAELRKFMHAHARSEPLIARRVGALFVSSIIIDEDIDDLMALRRVLPPLPFDPNLNRAAALMSEYEGDLGETERYWNAYITDLQACEALPASQRTTAVALVYQRIAAQFAEAAHEAEDWPDFMRGYDDDEYSERLRQDAERYLRKSQDTDPNLRDTYLELGYLLRMREKTTEAAATYKELGRRFPDDFEAMTAIATHFINENEPGVAKTYALKARALRPRDNAALDLVWTSCIATAREAAKMRRFGLAEAELDEAETLVGCNGRHTYLLYSIRAAVAFKENRRERGEGFLKQTLGQFEKPTAGMLIVHSQVLHCGVTDHEIREDLKERLQKALKGRKNAQAAGVMANYMCALEQVGVTYPGMAEHLKQVAAYLNQCGRVKWQPQYLIDACRFASNDPERKSLLDKLAARGRRLFSKNPYFHFFAGQVEMLSGPHCFNSFTATNHFERAIELSKSGDMPLAELDRQATSRALSLLEHNRRRASLEFNPFDTWDSDDDPDESEDDAGFDAAKLEEVLATMPPELRKELDASGIDPETFVKSLVKKLRLTLG